MYVYRCLIINLSSSIKNNCMIHLCEYLSFAMIRCGKGTTFEGGTRVPGLINFPMVLKPGVFNGIFSHMDFMQTGWSNCYQGS